MHTEDIINFYEGENVISPNLITIYNPQKTTSTSYPFHVKEDEKYTKGE